MNTTILEKTARLFLWIVAVLSVILLLRGHNLPGVALSQVLYYLSDSYFMELYSALMLYRRLLNTTVAPGWE